MNRHIFLNALIAIVMLTCFSGLPVIAGETLYQSIPHDGLEREYIIYIPDSYTGDSPVPLVLNFHGYTSNAFQQMNYGDFRWLADQHGFIVVHPEGTLLNGNAHWNVGGWTQGSTVDDVGFTNALIDHLVATYTINPDRVYSTGMSNGGYMSFLLACQLGDRIAAIASVTGSMTNDTYDQCSPARSIPILQFHGTSDPVVPYNGNSFSKAIDDVLQYWVSNSNCATAASVIDIPDMDPNDGSTVEHYTFSGGDNGSVIEHFKIHGGMHTWPGSAFGGTGTNYDIDASAEIWDFFSRYDINGPVNPGTPTPTPTPGPGDMIQLDLELSRELFNTGDSFLLMCFISNTGPDLTDQPLVIVLDAYGEYFWYPEWTQDFNSVLLNVGSGNTDMEILNFTWPVIDGSADGIKFYGALLSPDYSEIVGNMDIVEFGWS